MSVEHLRHEYLILVILSGQMATQKPPNNDDDSSGLEEAFTTPSTSTPGQASNSGAHAECRADATINSADFDGNDTQFEVVPGRVDQSNPFVSLRTPIASASPVADRARHD
ncbi:hypothetical protein K443DRAFT_3673 [Laccaria amethystina LaAM-08-1]|uniref:Uncharacterized protein n=1 Tax=Laccaria amethystina LaAM-08-1 TaxID=1095629 RepID=A0A0C9YC02_9AGAR|nr:hypothetical protein K443DRAFT_3673 [Laccaria amethystina LaAM-08-1]